MNAKVMGKPWGVALLVVESLGTKHENWPYVGVEPEQRQHKCEWECEIESEGG